MRTSRPVGRQVGGSDNIVKDIRKKNCQPRKHSEAERVVTKQTD